MTAAITPDPDEHRPVFRAFQWTYPEQFGSLPPGDVLPVISTIRDLSAGAALMMQIIEHDIVASGDEDFRPMFDPVQQGDLLRWAIVSMKLVAKDAGDLLSGAHTARSRPPDGTTAGLAPHSA